MVPSGCSCRPPDDRCFCCIFTNYGYPFTSTERWVRFWERQRPPRATRGKTGGPLLRAGCRAYWSSCKPVPPANICLHGGLPGLLGASQQVRHLRTWWGRSYVKYSPKCMPVPATRQPPHPLFLMQKKLFTQHYLYGCSVLKKSKKSKKKSNL